MATDINHLNYKEVWKIKNTWTDRKIITHTNSNYTKRLRTKIDNEYWLNQSGQSSNRKI